MMKRMPSILLIFLVFPLLGLAEEQQIHKPRVQSYELEVGFYPDARMDYAGFIEVLYGKRPAWNKEDSVKEYPHMKGRAALWVDLGDKGRDSLALYLHGELRAHRVKWDGEILEFTQVTVFYPRSYSLVANRITIPLREARGKHRLEMDYGGMFNPCYAGSPSNYMRIDSRGVYLRAMGYSLWFPVLQTPGADSAPVDFEKVKITTPERFVAVFTGQRISEDVKDHRRVSLWRGEGISLWNAQVTARPYRITENKGIFLYHLDHPLSVRASRDILTFIRQLLSFYSEHYREVAATPQLHVAELPNFASGISSGNMIGMTSGQWRRFSLSDDDADLELLVSHELVHSFVQLPVALDSPLSALIVEGFPSYFHLPALARILGEDWYRAYISKVETSYLKRKATGKDFRGNPLPPEKPILSLTFNDISRYKDTFILNDRVRLFLNYIREKTGKKRFLTFTRELCGLSHPTPETFIELIEKYLPGSGSDIRLWLESNDYPERFRLNH